MGQYRAVREAAWGSTGQLEMAEAVGGSEVQGRLALLSGAAYSLYLGSVQ